MNYEDMSFESLKQLDSERLYTGVSKLKNAIKVLEDKPSHLITQADRANLRRWRSALRNAELALKTKQNKLF